MDVESYRAAVEPKVQGSWNLHNLLPKGMDFFVLLSSMSGIFGARGQSNYASGNTYQDALARHRINIGEKAVALDLGMMLDVGIVAESKSIRDGMDAAGYYVCISETELHALLDRYCNPGLGLLSRLESQIVMGPAVTQELKSRDFYWMHKPIFRHLWQLAGSAGSPSSDSNAESIFDASTRLRAAESLHDATAVVCEALVKKLSKALGIPEADLDPSRPLHYYGVDSLVAVELRSWFAKHMNADIAIFEIMGVSSVTAVSKLVASKSLWWNSRKTEIGA
jgi:aryl carrier-like protein